jgi:uncharacterized membrane protein
MQRVSMHAGRPFRPGTDQLLAVFAGIGTLLSAYLLAGSLTRTALYCPLGSGCDIVQSSRYATVFGVPVAALGLLYYAIMLVLAIRPATTVERWTQAFPLAAASLAASGVFVVIQQTAIHATCSLCVLSALLTATIFFYLVYQRPAGRRNRTWGWAAAFTVGAAVFLAGAYAASAPKAAVTDYATGLARHLTNSGVKFYGAFWCPHCKDQKAMFVKAAGLLPYIECDPRSPVGQPQVCQAAGIRAFPTWDISDRRFEGVLSLEDLAKLTGYPPP